MIDVMAIVELISEREIVAKRKTRLSDPQIDVLRQRIAVKIGIGKEESASGEEPIVGFLILPV